MAKRLSCLAGRDLTFIDETQAELVGIILQIPTEYDLNGIKKYFFVSDKTVPFRISANGKNKTSVSQDHKKLYGYSKNYQMIANQDELKALEQIEGLLNWANPAREIKYGRGHPSLISKYIIQNESIKQDLFPQGFSSEN